MDANGMNEKKWHQSKTIWGALVALGAAAAGLFGVEVDGAASEALATAAGTLLAIVGRLEATSRIV